VSLWLHLTHGLRALVRRSDAERDATDEVRHYLEEAAADYEARGLSRREALRRVRLEHGGELQARARLHDYGWENRVEALWVDLRLAVRRLVREPVFTVVAVLTLAVGLGATTAIFSAVDTILLQPLPYPGADRVVSVWDKDSDTSPLATTFGTLRELTQRSRSFDSLAALKPWQPSLSGLDHPLRLDGQRVGADYFRVLGVHPALGRDFRPSDDRVGGPARVILSDALWRRTFAADPDILERPVVLDGKAFEVIGVMPSGFENVTAPSALLWATLQYDMSQGRAWGHHLRMVGRLRPGVALDTAGRELDEIAGAPIEAFPRPPWADLRNGLVVRSLQDEVTGAVKPALLAILGAAGLLLAIVGVNVTHLLFARGARRRGELALRTALGAGRERLVRQLLTESLVLAAAGGAVGTGLAYLGARALVALAPADLPRLHAISIDGSVLLLLLVLTTLIGAATGLVPALQATLDDPRAGLQIGSLRSPLRRQGARRALVVAEVALAVVLLVGSGLLLRSLQGLLAVEPGFDPAGLQTLQVQVSGDRYDDHRTEAFFAQALEAVRALPGVTAAAFTNQLPLSGDDDVYGLHLDAEPADERREDAGVFRYAVSPGYLEAMGIPLRRGRTFDRRDGAAGPRVAIVSESVVRRRLPGLDPLGQTLRIGPQDSPPYTIVGVVGDVRQESLDLGGAEAVYVPAGQWHFADDVRSLVVRGANLDGSLMAGIREAIWSVDKNRPIVRVATMDELVAASVAERKFTLILFQAFALASLFLAAVGIYGVLAGSVGERGRELGIRAALGASSLANTMLVLRQGLTLTALGAVLGLAAALAATRTMVSMLYGVSNLDPLTYAGVAALLTAVTAVACLVPALRAGRVDPATTLRAE